LVQDGLGLFPDAPTKRGTKHLYELADKGEGLVVFVAQRCDAEAVTFHSAMDDIICPKIPSPIIIDTILYLSAILKASTVSS